MNNKERILLLLLENGEMSTGGLCKSLGYFKNGRAQYKNIEKDLQTLYSYGYLKTQKKKTGGRPGSFWSLRKEMKTLKGLWSNYANLRGYIHNSEYFHSLLPQIKREVKNQIHHKFYFTPEDERKTNNAISELQSFANLVLTSQLYEKIKLNFPENFPIGVRNAPEQYLSQKLIDGINKNSQSTTQEYKQKQRLAERDVCSEALLEVINACAFFDGHRSFITDKKQEEKRSGYRRAVRDLTRSNFITPQEERLLEEIIEYRSRKGLSLNTFSPFKWLKNLPAHKRSAVLSNIKGSNMRNLLLEEGLDEFFNQLDSDYD